LQNKGDFLNKNPLWLVIGSSLLGVAFGTLATLIVTSNEGPVGEVKTSVDRLRMILVCVCVVNLLLLLGVVIYD